MFFMAVCQMLLESHYILTLSSLIIKHSLKEDKKDVANYVKVVMIIAEV